MQKNQNMFENILGNLKTQQQQIRQQLAKTIVEGNSGNDEVVVQCNGNREVVNIKIDRNKLNWEDQEQVEELTMVAVNHALQLAVEKETEINQMMMQQMLPGDLEGMKGLFS